MTFYEREHSNETKTRWLLHQYRLISSMATLGSNQMLKWGFFGDWLVFQVFQRKQKVKKHGVISKKRQTTSAVTMASCINCTVEDCSIFGLPQLTSPSSDLFNCFARNEKWIEKKRKRTRRASA